MYASMSAKTNDRKLEFSLTETMKLILPAMVIELLLAIGLLLLSRGVVNPNLESQYGFLIGIFLLVHIVLMAFVGIPFSARSQMVKWTVSILSGLLLGYLISLPDSMPSNLPILIYALVILISALVLGRSATYAMVVFSAIVYQLISYPPTINLTDYLFDSATPLLVAFAITETIIRLRDVLLDQLNRLAIINQVARSLASSLEIRQVLSLLSNAIQTALDADTYYFGLIQKDRIHLELFYDDGQFYPPIDIPLENTLAGWVVSNRKSLFMNNLLKDRVSRTTKVTIVGAPRTSLSWMGTPLIAGDQVIGLVAVASYRQRAFSKDDLSILESISQQGSMALDNAFHHQNVEHQSKIDSLTETFNHGCFIVELNQEIENAKQNQTSLSLIMLDVDNFKNYNDNYGHLVGDQVLRKMSDIIRRHIKKNDFIGRWGGEEFAIALPGANLKQAWLVADRIRQSLKTMKLVGRDNGIIPAPTISQGIGSLQLDDPDGYPLIDRADQFLYQAKEYGRDSIQPDPVAKPPSTPSV